MTDIVDWLRSILNNDRSVELRCREAADTIEELTSHIEDLVTKCEQLQNERDEARRELSAARRELCRNEAIIRLQRHHVHRDSEDVVGLAKEIAVERGWDCFKEKES